MREYFSSLFLAKKKLHILRVAGHGIESAGQKNKTYAINVNFLYTNIRNHQYKQILIMHY
jgi:hypothetical protein